MLDLMPNSIAIHQPHLFPWLPYISRLSHVETFVVLDSVQYRKNYFQHRCKMYDLHNKPYWLSYAVKGSLSTKINEVKMASIYERVQKKMEARVYFDYSRSVFFNEVWPPLRDFFSFVKTNVSELSLANISVASIKLLYAMLGLREPQIILASSLNIPLSDKTDYVINLINAVGATNYLCGWGGSVNPNTFNIEAFKMSGINVWFIDKEKYFYNRPLIKPTIDASTLSLLFLYGSRKIREIVSLNPNEYLKL